MKTISFTLYLLAFIFIFSSFHSVAQVCDCSDEDSGPASSLTSSDGFESYNSGVRLPASGLWSVFPPEAGYNPVSGTVVSSPVYCGSKSLRLQYANSLYEDILYSIEGWRTSFQLFVPSGKSSQIAYLDAANNPLFFVIFNSNGTAKASKSITSNGTGFNYTQNAWQRFSVLASGAQWLIFLGNDHIATIENSQGTLAKKLNLFAQINTDLFYIDKLCHLSAMGLVTCTLEFAPVCLKKSNIQAGTNDCYATSAGFLPKEFYECSFSTGNACDDALPISCGQTISSTTLGESYKFYRPDYGSCLPQSGAPDFRAPDKVFKFTKPDNTGDVGIHLWGKTKNVDLDVFLIDKCGKSWVGGGGGGGGGDIGIVVNVPPSTPNNPNINCIASGTSTVETSGFDNDFINFPNLPSGEYYIIVDGQHWQQTGFTDDAGDFDLSLTCYDLNCSNATLMQCDVTLANQSNANGENNVSVYCSAPKQISGDKSFLPAGSGCTGKEKVYTFIAARTGEMTISLTGVDANEDFELFLFSSCNHTNCLASKTNSSGINEVIKYNVVNGNRYYIVVDGYKGTVGNFNLTIEGCAATISRCANIEELSCGTRYPKTTLTTTNRFNKSDYSSCLQTNDTYDGNDIVFKYKVTNQFPNPTVLLWGYTTDLDLFILNDCGSPAKCIKSSTSSSRAYEYIDMAGLPLGDYFIVVDGKNANQKSDFKISVACQPGCSDPATIDLVCNTSVVGNTSACEINYINKYSCDPDYRFSGPECYYHFTAPEAGEYTFDLFGFANNLDLFVLDYRSCAINPKCLGYGANLNAGTAEKVKVTLVKNQTITVVVDGTFGDEGPYALTTTCPNFNTEKLVFDIDDDICDAKGKTVKVPVRVTNFKNIRSFTMTVQVEDKSIGAITNISSTLNGFDKFESEVGKTYTIRYNNSTPLTLTDGSIAFTIEVLLNGNLNQSTKLNLISAPLSIAAAKLENGTTSSIPVEVKSGGVCIKNKLAQISGQVKTRKNEGIFNATVSLHGPLSLALNTDQNGNYTVPNLNTGTYTISVQKQNNSKNGVDIFDLSAIEDHIITRKLITDPYRLLAADVNNDQSIDIFDLSDMEDIIITRKANFNDNLSWRFIPTTENLTIEKVKAKTYSTTRTINATGDHIGLDYYGIKTGDIVDDNANPKDVVSSSEINFQSVESRTLGSLSLKIPETKAKKNESIFLPIVLESFKDVRAFQFQVKWNVNALNLVGITDAIKQLTGFGQSSYLYDANVPGVLNVLWKNTDNQSLNNNTVLLRLNLKVLANTGDLLNLQFLEVKANSLEGAIVNPAFTNGKVTVADISTKLDFSKMEYSKFDIYPNPGSHQIKVSYPKAFDLISIIDVYGKHYPLYYRGQNNYTLDLTRFTSGIYFIQSNIDGKPRVQKFIVHK